MYVCYIHSSRYLRTHVGVHMYLTLHVLKKVGQFCLNPPFVQIIFIQNKFNFIYIDIVFFHMFETVDFFSFMVIQISAWVILFSISLIIVNFSCIVKARFLPFSDIFATKSLQRGTLVNPLTYTARARSVHACQLLFDCVIFFGKVPNRYACNGHNNEFRFIISESLL